MVVIVRVELWPEVTEVGVKERVVPAGAPVAVRPTVWVLPLVVLVPIVVSADWPAVTVSAFGEAVTAKSSMGVALTVS